MGDHLNLTLDPETERALVKRIDEEIEHGRFSLSHGKTLVIDGGSEPSQSELVSTLKRYIDFEGHGLKLLEVERRGTKARFLLVPGWETSPADVRGKTFGGPSISLRFTMTW